jgi:hypothetical protein
MKLEPVTLGNIDEGGYSEGYLGDNIRARMKRDKKEKDALAWFDPAQNKLMGRWSPKLVPMYIGHFSQPQ